MNTSKDLKLHTPVGLSCSQALKNRLRSSRDEGHVGFYLEEHLWLLQHGLALRLPLRLRVAYVGQFLVVAAQWSCCSTIGLNWFGTECPCPDLEGTLWECSVVDDFEMGVLCCWVEQSGRD